MKAQQKSKNDSSKWEIVRPPLAPKFQLPSKADLFDVVSGDDVKLIFKAGDDIEKMWVRVEQCGDSTEWTGWLDNEPVQDYISSVLKHGDPVKFHPYDIVSVEGGHDNVDRNEIEQIVDTRLSQATNISHSKWYKNPQIIVPAIVGLLGVLATVTAAILAS